MKSLLLGIILLLSASLSYAQDEELAEWQRTCLVGAEYQFNDATIKACKPRGFFKPYGLAFKVSSAVYWSGVFADMANSRSKIASGKFVEANPFVRTRDGRLSVPKSIAYTGALYGATLLIEKKKPKLASIIRFIAGGIHISAAVAQR